MKIAVDAMGGDNAPISNIEGAIAALDSENMGQISNKHKIEIALIGRKDLIKKELFSRGASALPIEIHDASQVIDMDEEPVEACRKKMDSSIVVGIMLQYQLIWFHQPSLYASMEVSKLLMELRITGLLTQHCFTFGHEFCRGLSFRDLSFLLPVYYRINARIIES